MFIMLLDCILVVRHKLVWLENHIFTFSPSSLKQPAGGILCQKTAYIISEIIASDNLNTPNLMQTFENLLHQNYST